jgi:hypothetical protein
MTETVKRKTTPKRGREKTPPIEINSEEDESPENTELEESQSGTEEESEEEDDEPEPELQRGKGKGHAQTPSKGKVTRVTKATASKRQPTRRKGVKQVEVPTKRLKKT